MKDPIRKSEKSLLIAGLQESYGVTASYQEIND